MPYIALTDLEIGASFKKGDVISEDFLRKQQRSGWVLVNQGLAKYDPSAKPTAPAPKAVEAEAPTVEVEEVFTPVEEKPTEPVKAEVSKHGVWYKVFAGSIQVGKPTRDEKIAKKIAKDFNANL
jgi:hypothetical protein